VNHPSRSPDGNLYVDGKGRLRRPGAVVSGMLARMADAPNPEVDPRRVRIGIIFLTVVVLAAIAIAVLVDNALARVVMIAIIVFTVVRTFHLRRSLRRS
jgi:hypothetical protein